MPKDRYLQDRPNMTGIILVAVQYKLYHTGTTPVANKKRGSRFAVEQFLADVALSQLKVVPRVSNGSSLISSI